MNGIKIRADRHDVNDTDFSNGINNCLTKDGQNAATGDLPMGTNKHTNVGKATALNQYATAEQVIDNELKYYVATGTNTYVITPSPAITAYAAGQSFFVNFTNANTGAATININSLGAKALTKNVSTALVSGDISAGKIYEIIYDGTQFQTKDAFTDTGITALTGDVTASGSGSVAATIANNAVTTAKINNDAVTLAKIQNAGANSVLLGSGASGSGADYSEITLGTNLSMSGTTLNAAGGGWLSDSYNYNYYYDDFVGKTVGGYTTSVSGAGAAVTLPIGSGAQVATGTTSTGLAYIQSISPAQTLSGAFNRFNNSVFDTQFYTGTISDGTNRFTTFIGIGSQIGSVFQNGVFFRQVDNVNSGNWQAVCRSAGVETVINTSVAGAANVIIYFKWVVNSAANSVEFFINNTSVGSITTNIPLFSSGSDMAATLAVVKSLGTASRTANVFNWTFVRSRI